MKVNKPTKIVLNMILGLNILMILGLIMPIYTIVNNANLGNEDVTLKALQNQLTEAQNKWDHLREGRLEKHEYIKKWREQDKEHLEHLSKNRVELKNEIY